ncbi:hypothetical protein HZB05_00090 [Candidatus Wolfebacteria bacterium]|nr:hypothetical protein [Candidatus Wolfebacteria bacterium]
MEKRPTDEEVLNGWKRAVESYQPGKLLPAEKAAFIRMRSAEESSKLESFTLPS